MPSHSGDSFSGVQGQAINGVTLVIPTLEREKFLLQTVEDILAQDYRPLEILIVDQSSSPSSKMKDLAAQYLDGPIKITYDFVNFRGLPVARNYAWKKAQFPLVLYIDDDIRCEKSFVRNHVEAHAEAQKQNPKSKIAIAGPVIEPHRPRKYRSSMGRFNYWTATPEGGFCGTQYSEVDLAPGGNCSLAKNWIEEIGGFDEILNIGAALYEESEFFLRFKKSGGRIFYAPQAGIIHLAAPSGGCRTPDPWNYVYSLVHNRTILIRRYLNWYHRPTAWVRLSLLVLSYIRLWKRSSLITAAYQGFQKAREYPVPHL